MVHYVRDGPPFANKFFPFCLQCGHPTGLKCEVGEQPRNAQALIDTGVLIRWDTGDVV